LHNLFSYFNPIEDGIISINWQSSQIGHCINKHSFNNEPNMEDVKVAFFLVPECTGTENKLTDTSLVRKELYALHFEDLPTLVDLGDLQIKSTKKETFKEIELVCIKLLKENILPLIIGGGNDISYAIYKAYASLEKIITFTSVDNSFDLGTKEDKINTHSYLSKIIAYQPNHLFNYCNIAYQSYFESPAAIDMLDKIYFDSYRLGFIKSNIFEVEPIMRNTDFLSFDISAISQAYASANVFASPNGLDGVESCSIMRYAGLSDKLTSCGIFEYNSTMDNHLQTAKIIAQMCWYFLDGFKQRKNELNPRLEECTKYTVSFDNGMNEVEFYKSNKTGRWWIGVPFSNSDNNQKDNYFVACSYRDYEKSNQGVPPERWIKTYQKMN
jgi:arginase family enzyme|tara:strand:- start:3563 stop:4714 length:1152 start_codon:yes stop_codon:yes gene_type:complete